MFKSCREFGVMGQRRRRMGLSMNSTKRICYLSIISVMVANAVIFQNVVDLTDVLRDLLKAGHLINREDVAALSPYMTSHIKRFGDYLIDMETVPNLLDDDGLLVLA
jgi:hypothetical protein